MEETAPTIPLRSQVQVPLIAPPGWWDLAPLVSRRHELGFRQSEVAAAMGVYHDQVSRAERGRLPTVSPRFRRRYREALRALKVARETREEG